MAIERKPFQGIFNIIRFNWHFYLIAAVGLTAVFFLSSYLPQALKQFLFIGTGLAIFTIILSLLISYYVYDVSQLYELPWLPDCDNKKVLNISAGFDETSDLILDKHPTCDIHIADFYQEEKHTEVSIKRARKAYPPPAATVSVMTESLPYPDNYFDSSFVILAAHEIRDMQELTKFFAELNRVTKKDGKVYVTEHLRDTPNFIAYTIGFLHFYSKSTWMTTFKEANFSVLEELNTTAFITTFILKNNGTTN